MKYDPAFIEAIKRCIHANVMVWRKMGGAGEEKARKEYSEAEAHLDSFGMEPGKVTELFT